MIKAAVLGSPITHSLSPVLHQRAYEILGVPARYEAIELIPSQALNFFRKALREDWRGFSLTMPLKETIFELTSEVDFDIDPIALRMRSANTLVKEGDGFRAISTDLTAFDRLLDPVEKARVAIIGGGGTARAVLAALDGKARQIDFLLRSPLRAGLLSDISLKSHLNFYGMDHSLQGYDLVISTVPSGASDGIAADIDFRIPTFFEVLYDPSPTPLLDKARVLGAQVFDGIDLLVEQALDQIALFSGKDFAFDAMRGDLLVTGRSHLK